MAPELPHGGSGAFLCSSLPSLALFALSGLPAYSLLCSSLLPALLAYLLLRSSLSPGYLPTLFCALRSFRRCLPTFSCAPRSLRATCRLSFALLALSGLPADSLLRSSLFPVLLANSLKPLLALPGCASAGRAPCMFRHGCPPSAFSRFPVPVRGTRLRRSLLSFGLFAPSGAVCLLS